MKSQVVEEPSGTAEKEQSPHPLILPVNEN